MKNNQTTTEKKIDIKQEVISYIEEQFRNAYADGNDEHVSHYAQHTIDYVLQLLAKEKQKSLEEGYLKGLEEGKKAVWKESYYKHREKRLELRKQYYQKSKLAHSQKEIEK